RRYFDIGQQFDRGAIQRDGAGRFQALEFLLLELELFLPQVVFGQGALVRIDDDHTLIAIDDDQFAVSDQAARPLQGDDGRDVQAARQNRRVRCRTADVGDEGGELVVLELDGIGR